MNLTKPERTELVELERTIERGLGTFREVGTALARIRDAKLYRDGHNTFEEYCSARWSFSRSYAYRLIAAAEVAENLSPMGDKPANERQARALGKAPPDQRPGVWGQAAADGKPTAARIEELTRKALAALTPEEQREVIEGAEEQAIRSSGSHQAAADGRRQRLAQAERLMLRAKKLYAGLGDEAEPILAAIDAALAAAAAV